MGAQACCKRSINKGEDFIRNWVANEHFDLKNSGYNEITQKITNKQPVTRVERKKVLPFIKSFIFNDETTDIQYKLYFINLFEYISTEINFKDGYVNIAHLMFYFFPFIKLDSEDTIDKLYFVFKNQSEDILNWTNFHEYMIKYYKFCTLVLTRLVLENTTPDADCIEEIHSSISKIFTDENIRIRTKKCFIGLENISDPNLEITQEQFVTYMKKIGFNPNYLSIRNEMFDYFSD